MIDLSFISVASWLAITASHRWLAVADSLRKRIRQFMLSVCIQYMCRNSWNVEASICRVHFISLPVWFLRTDILLLTDPLSVEWVRIEWPVWPLKFKCHLWVAFNILCNRPKIGDLFVTWPRALHTIFTVQHVSFELLVKLCVFYLALAGQQHLLFLSTLSCGFCIPQQHFVISHSHKSSYCWQWLSFVGVA